MYPPLPGLMELKSNLGVNTKAEVVVHHVQRWPKCKNQASYKPSNWNKPVDTSATGRLMLAAWSGG